MWSGRVDQGRSGRALVTSRPFWTFLLYPHATGYLIFYVVYAFFICRPDRSNHHNEPHKETSLSAHRSLPPNGSTKPPIMLFYMWENNRNNCARRIQSFCLMPLSILRLYFRFFVDMSQCVIVNYVLCRRPAGNQFFSKQKALDLT